MTEKRFAISSDNNQNIYDTEEKCYYSSIDAKKLCDLLNDLSEENEQLKIRFKEEEWHYDHIDEDRDVWRHKCQELERENEELKKQLKSKEKAHTRCDELYQKLYDENDELKKILKFLRNDNATDILNVLNSQENQIWELKKEVEQLKNKIKTYNSANELLKETIDRLRSDG